MAPELGVEIESVQLRDLMLPGESAALRSLANAARVMDSTPGLMNLRLLQTMEQDAGVIGVTTRFVVHMPGGPATGAGADPPTAAAG